MRSLKINKKFLREDFRKIGVTLITASFVGILASPQKGLGVFCILAILGITLWYFGLLEKGEENV